MIEIKGDFQHLKFQKIDLFLTGEVPQIISMEFQVSSYLLCEICKFLGTKKLSEMNIYIVKNSVVHFH